MNREKKMAGKMTRKYDGVGAVMPGDGGAAAAAWQEGHEQALQARRRARLLLEIGAAPGWLAVCGRELLWVIGGGADSERLRCLRLSGGRSETVELRVRGELAALEHGEAAAGIALATAGLDGTALTGLSEVQLSVVARVLAEALFGG